MRKFIGLTLVLLVVVVIAAGAFPAQAQGMKIGVFDPQRISTETAEGQRVQSQLAALRDRMQQDISSKEQTIKGLQQQLDQQKLSLSADKRTTLEMNIQRKLLELNNANEMASRELQLEVAAAQAAFNEKLVAVVQSFGRDEGFDLIIDSSLVAFSSDSISVSTSLIDSFNRKFPAQGE